MNALNFFHLESKTLFNNMFAYCFEKYPDLNTTKARQKQQTRLQNSGNFKDISIMPKTLKFRGLSFVQFGSFPPHVFTEQDIRYFRLSGADLILSGLYKFKPLFDEGPSMNKFRS